MMSWEGNNALLGTAGGGYGWLPADCVFFLDPQDVAQNGQWIDRSGNDYHFTVVNGSVSVANGPSTNCIARATVPLMSRLFTGGGMTLVWSGMPRKDIVSGPDGLINSVVGLQCYEKSDYTEAANFRNSIFRVRYRGDGLFLKDYVLDTVTVVQNVALRGLRAQYDVYDTDTLFAAVAALWPASGGGEVFPALKAIYNDEIDSSGLIQSQESVAYSANQQCQYTEIRCMQLNQSCGVWNRVLTDSEIMAIYDHTKF